MTDNVERVANPGEMPYELVHLTEEEILEGHREASATIEAIRSKILSDPSHIPTLADFPSYGPGCVLETHRTFSDGVLMQFWYVRQDDLADMERDRLFAEITGIPPLNS